MKRIFCTDGSTSGNPGPGGYAVIEIQDNYILYNYYEYCDHTTNNREELKAIIHVFQNFGEAKDNIVIYSDSAYCVNMINDWIWKWSTNDWKNSKGREVENIDLVQILFDLLLKYKNHIEVNKIKGHNGHIGNELADAIASANKQKYITLCRKHNIEDF